MDDGQCGREVVCRIARTCGGERDVEPKTASPRGKKAEIPVDHERRKIERTSIAVEPQDQIRADAGRFAHADREWQCVAHPRLQSWPRAPRGNHSIVEAC